jgi:hypothetical protein
MPVSDFFYAPACPWHRLVLSFNKTDGFLGFADIEQLINDKVCSTASKTKSYIAMVNGMFIMKINDTSLLLQSTCVYTINNKLATTSLTSSEVTTNSSYYVYI